MAETHPRQGPLAHLSLPPPAAEEAAGVVLRHLPLRAMITVRGDGQSSALQAAVTAATGMALPTEANTAGLSGSGSILWLGPDQWLVVGRPEERADLPMRMRAALDAEGAGHAAVTEWGEGMTIIGLGGPHAPKVLAKGCTLDLHPRAFAAGQCAGTLLAKAHVILHQMDDAPTYSLYVHRSFAAYLWRWLEDAALEYGVSASELADGG